jgi:hypothetical protein
VSDVVLSEGVQNGRFGSQPTSGRHDAGVPNGPRNQQTKTSRH